MQKTRTIEEYPILRNVKNHLENPFKEVRSGQITWKYYFNILSSFHFLGSRMFSIFLQKNYLIKLPYCLITSVGDQGEGCLRLR
jgi:hypothetical protein